MVCQLQYNRFGSMEVTFRPRSSQLEREREMILRGSYALDDSDLGESEAGDADVYYCEIDEIAQQFVLGLDEVLSRYSFGSTGVQED
jgi:hypothetical protein